MNKNEKLIKKLVDSYGVFLASDSVMPLIPRLIGNQISKAGKFPRPLHSNDNIVNKIDEVRKTIKLKLYRLLSIGVAVGNISMDEKQIYTNIIMTINYLLSEILPRRWENVRCL